MSLNFAIVGAGWYGCHIASAFSSLGFEVTLFEKSDSILSRASGNNQFRLHQGFHYARNHRTRVQSRDGFLRFIERYPGLSLPIENNLYAVPRLNSLIDFETYRIIMASSGLDFKELSCSNFSISNCSGLINTNERLLLIQSARDYFNKKLNSLIKLNFEVNSVHETLSKIIVNGESFDYLIDSTWGEFSSIGLPVFFEPTLLFYYYSKNISSFALTLVDGPLCSIYPTEFKNTFTLSSVLHTPIGKYSKYDEAFKATSSLKTSELKEKQRLMEAQISEYYPNFKNDFSYIGPQFSVKTKIIGSSDDRSCYVNKSGRRFIVMSGKIDTIFFAAESILSMLDLDS